MAIAVRAETQFGYAIDVGTSYVQVGSDVAAGHDLNLLLSVTNLLNALSYLRAFIVDTSWTSGLPTGSAKVHTIAMDMEFLPGETKQLTGYILIPTQGIVVRGNATGAFDVLACGQDLTLA